MLLSHYVRIYTLVVLRITVVRHMKTKSTNRTKLSRTIRHCTTPSPFGCRAASVRLYRMHSPSGCGSSIVIEDIKPVGSWIKWYRPRNAAGRVHFPCGIACRQARVPPKSPITKGTYLISLLIVLDTHNPPPGPKHPALGWRGSTSGLCPAR